MKNILLLMTLVIVSAFAKPCMTDIYFGNGVWNTEKDAIYSKNVLRKFMLSKAITKLDINKEGIDFNFKHAYNYSGGTYIDLIETFWQLKESGQIDEGLFQTIAKTLAIKDGAGTPQEIKDKIQYIITYYNDNADIMFQTYQNSSFNQKHNVLLVAHSQGNLFGNKMYTLMSDAQKNKFRMVSVATPADHVAGDGPYVTAVGDYVIGPIPGSLPGNVDGVGHTFVGTYLNGSINAPRKIALHIKTAYDNLMQTTSCTTYAFVKVLMPGFGHLKIVGQPLNINAYEDVGELFIGHKKAIKTVINGITYYSCTSPYTIYDEFGGGGSNWSFYNDGNTSKMIEWNPGRIHNKNELNNRSGIREEVLSGSYCLTLSLEEGKPLYDFLSNVF